MQTQMAKGTSTESTMGSFRAATPDSRPNPSQAHLWFAVFKCKAIKNKETSKRVDKHVGQIQSAEKYIPFGQNAHIHPAIVAVWGPSSFRQRSTMGTQVTAEK